MVWLVLLVLTGLFVILRGAGMLVICLQYGTKAYFTDGLRPIRGFNLNNGQRVAVGDQMLFIATYLVVMPLWILLALLITTGLSRLTNPWHQRRLKKKMDELHQEWLRRKAGRGPS